MFDSAGDDKLSEQSDLFGGQLADECELIEVALASPHLSPCANTPRDEFEHRKDYYGAENRREHPPQRCRGRAGRLNVLQDGDVIKFQRARRNMHS